MATEEPNLLVVTDLANVDDPFAVHQRRDMGMVVLVFRCREQNAEAPFVAISNEQSRLLNGLNIVGTVLHGIDTDSFEFRSSQTTTCCSSAGSPRARAYSRRSRSPSGVGMRLILAAAEDDYYRATSRRRWTANTSSTSARPMSRPRCSSSAAPGRCSTRSGGRALRSGARRSDGLRHAGRGAGSRRRARGRRGRRDRHRLQRRSRHGRPAWRACLPSTASACASVESRGSAPCAWLTSTSRSTSA